MDWSEVMTLRDLMQQLVTSQPKDQHMSYQWLRSHNGHRRLSSIGEMILKYQNVRRMKGKVIATDVDVDWSAD